MMAGFTIHDFLALYSGSALLRYRIVYGNFESFLPMNLVAPYQHKFTNCFIE